MLERKSQNNSEKNMDGLLYCTVLYCTVPYIPYLKDDDQERSERLDYTELQGPLFTEP